MSKYLYVVLILTIVSCATSVPKLTEKAKEVYFLRPQEGKCELIQKGFMVTQLFGNGSAKVAENTIKNRAAEEGANVVALSSITVQNIQARVNIYKCSDEYISKYKNALKKR